MFSPEMIREMSDEAARKAARTKRQPYVPFSVDEIRRMPPFPFPNLGTYVPPGWELVEELFCDSSGFGSDSEPALSLRQVKEKLIEHAKSEAQYGYGVRSTGQFQLYLGVFRRIATSKQVRKKSS